MSFRIDGLEAGLNDLYRAPERLPEHTKAMARGIVEDAVESTAAKLRSEPRGTLAGAVTIRKTRDLSGND